MKILGLSLGELATAAVMVDGRVVAAASEERFSRAKNDERYPRQAIDYCLKQAGVAARDLDAVAIPGMSLAFGPWVTRSYSTFSIADHIRAQREYWYPKLYGQGNPVWTEVFRDKVDTKQFPGTLGQLLGSRDAYYSEDIWPQFRELLYKGMEDHLGVSREKFVHADHHTCHAAYAYWGSPFRGDPALVLTADAWGDDLSATVSVMKDGAIARVHAVKHTEFRLARLYRYITLLLGMKPNEHEYKVMGLAPYAKPQLWRGPYEVFRKTMRVDGLGFAWDENPKDMYFYFKEKLEGFRFDGIAGGLQKYLEEILSEWVSNAVKATGIRRVVFSGGIAMNVKAMKTLHELPEVDELFVPGSGSDESLAVGICYHLMEKRCRETGQKTDAIAPVSLYQGPRFSSAEIMAWVDRQKLGGRYGVETGVTPDRVAGALAEGNVIGRCAGRMELGARALGNRSILADPRSPRMIEKINDKIKNRDFWMPFAPSILAEAAGRYLVNPKKLKAPVMSVAFDSTDAARKDLAAALHPSDHTLRPNVVEKGENPEYHAILSAFEKRTGVGGLLNTSFNLHGEPIVCGPDDALHVFEESDIDMILLEDVLISKRKAGSV